MNEQRHWLYRPATIARLIAWGVGALLVIVLAQLFVTLYQHFAFTGWFGFHAVFGFVSCVLIVFIARGFARVVERRADYYEGGPMPGSVPDASTPAASVPAASVPGASTPAASAPAASATGASTPAASAPAASATGASTPAASVPAASTPAASMPAASMPDASTPDASVPGGAAGRRDGEGST